MKLDHKKCIDCPEKRPRCHSKCNHYKIVELFNNRIREKKRKETDLLGFILDTRKRIYKISFENNPKRR